MSSYEVMWTKVRNIEKISKQLFSEKRDSDHMKYKYRIIYKLISIKILWKLSYLNILIKDKL